MLRANYGQNPWQEQNQVITSISWVSRIEDAKESLLRSHWDLIIVDEAHKMARLQPTTRRRSPTSSAKSLSAMTDHYLLMTATPHKGDPENFCLFLALLDRDVYGNVKSLEEAMRRHDAPFYLRRTKEALVSFPDPETGEVKKLFTKREVRTTSFELDGDEFDFYDALTRYVEDQSIKASRGRQRPRPRARLHDGDAPAPLGVQRLRRAPQPRAHERQAARRSWTTRRSTGRSRSSEQLPDDFDDLPEDEQMEIDGAGSKDVVASVDPAALREEIQRLGKLIDQARAPGEARDRDRSS